MITGLRVDHSTLLTTSHKSQIKSESSVYPLSLLTNVVAIEVHTEHRTHQVSGSLEQYLQG